MTKQEKQTEIARLQSEANSVKSELMRIQRAMERLSPRIATRLDKTIANLESWQHYK